LILTALVGISLIAAIARMVAIIRISLLIHPQLATLFNNYLFLYCRSIRSLTLLVVSVLYVILLFGLFVLLFYYLDLGSFLAFPITSTLLALTCFLLDYLILPLCLPQC